MTLVQCASTQIYWSGNPCRCGHEYVSQICLRLRNQQICRSGACVAVTASPSTSTLSLYYKHPPQRFNFLANHLPDAQPVRQTNLNAVVWTIVLWLVKKWPVGWNRNGHIGRKSIDLEAGSDTKCWSLCLLVYMVSHLRAPTSLSYQPPTLLGAPSINLGAPILNIRSCIQSNMREAIQDIRQTSSSILMQRLVSNWGIIQDPLKYLILLLTGHRIRT